MIQKTTLAVWFVLAGIFAYQTGSAIAVVLMQQTSLWPAVYLKAIGTAVLAGATMLFMRKRLVAFCSQKKNKAFFLFLFFSLVDSIGWMGSIYYNGLTGSAIMAKLIPLTLVLYGLIVFKERLTIYQLIAGACMIVASLAFSSHAFLNGEAMGLVFQAILIFGYCGFAIMQRYMAGQYDAYAVMWARAMFISLFAILFTPLVFNELASFDLSMLAYLLLLAGLFGYLNGFVKHSFTMTAYRFAPMSFVSLVGEVSLPLSFLIGFFVFQEEMSTIKWLATIAAFLAMAVLTVGQWQRGRAVPQNSYAS